MYKKVLIANRGEIALRIERTLREMGISSVAVYSDADRDARFVQEADEAYRIGPPPAPASYLNHEVLIGAALTAGCDGIHPGYGFLAENADFADAVAAAGIRFIGPSPESMRLMGDKITARRLAQEAGVPVVPGSVGGTATLQSALDFVSTHGAPVLVKAAGGGGGRGIRIVEREGDLEEALERASKEAETYFHNPDVYIERFFPNARHIEIQIAGDVWGEVVAWGERDCSLQRKRQKLIEETPAPGLPPAERTALMDSAVSLAKRADYCGVGTVEFLHAGPGEFFFLEMNTRIQVEHTISEEVTNQDLVRESIELSCGSKVVRDLELRGHAIEVRINAEDPARNFAPGPGLLKRYQEPGGPGVRVDSGVYQGFTIPGNYDSLIAKVIVHAPNRERAIERILGALRTFEIEGVPTTIPLLTAVVESETFRSGSITTDWLDSHLTEIVGEPQAPPQAGNADAGSRRVDVEVNGKRFEVRIREDSPAAGRVVERRKSPSRRSGSQSSNAIISPMHGTVLAVKKSEGETVTEGEAIFVLEAMKMENEIRTHRAGKLATIHVAVGDTVEVDQPLAELAP